LERSDNPPQPLRPLAGGSILERQRQPTTGPLRPLAAGCVPVRVFLTLLERQVPANGLLIVL